MDKRFLKHIAVLILVFGSCMAVIIIINVISLLIQWGLL